MSRWSTGLAGGGEIFSPRWAAIASARDGMPIAAVMSWPHRADRGRMGGFSIDRETRRC